jgi:hypothetical protein
MEEELKEVFSLLGPVEEGTLPVLYTITGPSKLFTACSWESSYFLLKLDSLYLVL